MTWLERVTRVVGWIVIITLIGTCAGMAFFSTRDANSTVRPEATLTTDTSAVVLIVKNSLLDTVPVYAKAGDAAYGIVGVVPPRRVAIFVFPSAQLGEAPHFWATAPIDTTTGEVVEARVDRVAGVINVVGLRVAHAVPDTTTSRTGT